jgi:hypothetical protein
MQRPNRHDAGWKPIETLLRPLSEADTTTVWLLPRDGGSSSKRVGFGSWRGRANGSVESLAGRRLIGSKSAINHGDQTLGTVRPIR